MEATVDNMPLRVPGWFAKVLWNLKLSPSMLHWIPRARYICVSAKVKSFVFVSVGRSEEGMLFQHILTPSASIFDERWVTLASVSDGKGYPCAYFFDAWVF